MPEEAPAPVPSAPEPSWRDRLDLIAGPQPLTPQQLALGAAGVVIALLAAWFLLREPTAPPAETVIPMAGATPGSTTSTTAAEVLVHAAGAVRTPGVYRLAPGARVTDLLDAAGGVAADADLDRLNLAAPVADGAQVYVPRAGEPAPAGAPGGGAGASTPTGPLDLNVATLEQLEELPGVGPATAKAIIDERERRGRFESVDDLLDVRGIGPAKLDGMRDLVTV